MIYIYTYTYFKLQIYIIGNFSASKQIWSRVSFGVFRWISYETQGGGRLDTLGVQSAIDENRISPTGYNLEI